MSGKFEIFKSEKNHQFYFRLKASNGRIILQSEGYKTKASCLAAVKSVKKYATVEKAYHIQNLHFNLKSTSNGKIIGSSEKYSSNAALTNGIASVMKNAPTAIINDLTVKAS